MANNISDLLLFLRKENYSFIKLKFNLNQTINEFKNNLTYTDYVRKSTYLIKLLFKSGKFQKLKENIVEILEAAYSINDYNSEIILLNILGTLHLLDESNFGFATRYFLEAYHINEQQNLNKKISILSGLGYLYLKLKNFDKAEEIFNQSHIEFENVGYLSSIEIKFYYKTLCLNHAYLKIKRKNIIKAVQYLEKAKKINIRDYSAELETLEGMIEFQNNNFNKALKLFDSALNRFQSRKISIQEIDHLIRLSKYYYKMKIFKKSLIILNIVETISKKNQLNKKLLHVYSYYIKIYTKYNRQDKILAYYKNYYEISHNLYNSERENQLTHAEINHEYYMSQRKIEQEKNEREKIELAYENLKIIGKLGNDLTSAMNLNEITYKLYENLNKVIDVDCLAIGIYNQCNDNLEFKIVIEQNIHFNIPAISLENKKSLAVKCFRGRSQIIINEFNKINNSDNISLNLFLKKNKQKDINSVLFLPLIQQNRVIGILTCQSYQKGYFSNNKINIIKTLSNFMSVAIINSNKKELLEKMSKYDFLTNIPNRRYFVEKLNKKWKEAAKCGHNLITMLIDLDYFKLVNDYYGHLHGDKCLKKISTILSKICEKDFFLARYGGDEFIAFATNTKTEKAIELAEKMRKEVSTTEFHPNYNLLKKNKKLSLTIGISSIEPQTSTIQIEDFIKKVDSALYNGKKNNRNIIQLID